MQGPPRVHRDRDSPPSLISHDGMAALLAIAKPCDSRTRMACAAVTRGARGVIQQRRA